MSRRIAIVANTTWNIYNFRLNLIEKLLDEDWTVTVIAPLDEYIEYKELYPTVKHIPLKQLIRNGSNPWKDMKLILELKSIYKKIKPDVILHYTHKPNIFGAFATKLWGNKYLKSIAVITGLGYPFINGGFSKSITSFLYKLSSRWHDAFIFENEDDMGFFINEKIIKEKQGYSVNGCGVDIEKFAPHPNGVHKSKTVFTFIGRLLYDKGIEEFVQAARHIKTQNSQAEFWIVGELDSSNPSMIKKEELLHWVDSEVVIYHGFVKDIRPVIAKSDCIVLPSYREGMPRTVLEGMSMGKPIITTDTAGCRQTVDDGISGYLVEVGNSEDLSHKMLNFMNLSIDQMHSMGDAGRHRALSLFNSEKIANDLYDIISMSK